MKRVLALAALFVFTGICPARAQVLTFETPQANHTMTNVFNGSHTLYFSATAPEFSFGDLSLSALGASQGGGVGTFIIRSTFDDRSPNPYPYRFIAGNVAQIDATGLYIEFPNGTDRFGFAAALDSTSGAGHMTVDAFGAAGESLGTYTVPLRRSSNTNGNTNSEGVFFVSDIGTIGAVTITNHGDPLNPNSLFGWVIDNIEYGAAGVAGTPGPTGPPGPIGPQGPAGPAGTNADVVNGSAVLRALSGPNDAAPAAPTGYLLAGIFKLEKATGDSSWFAVYLKAGS
ncbi:MAG TPA: hypothetical protein VGF24_08920 [Vicinamibacterales bacterium]|jgi:hypothetical protein